MIFGANGRPLVRRCGFYLPGEEWREDQEGETAALVGAVGDWRAADVSEFDDPECKGDKS